MNHTRATKATAAVVRPATNFISDLDTCCPIGWEACPFPGGYCLKRVLLNLTMLGKVLLNACFGSPHTRKLSNQLLNGRNTLIPEVSVIVNVVAVLFPLGSNQHVMELERTNLLVPDGPTSKRPGSVRRVLENGLNSHGVHLLVSWEACGELSLRLVPRCW